MTTKENKKFLGTLAIAMALYLFYQWAFMLGALNERVNSTCVTPYALELIDREMDMTDKIVEQLNSSHYELKLKAEDEIRYWKNNYFWLKEQKDLIINE